MVKWTMRAVLASPIVVLLVWSTCAILFTSSTNNNLNKSSPLRQAMPSQTQQHVPQQQQQSRRGNSHNSNVVIRPRPPPRGAAADAVTGAVMNGNNYMATNTQTQNTQTQNQVVPPEQFLAAAPDASVQVPQQQQQPDQFLASQTQPQYMSVQDQQNQVVQPEQFLAAAPEDAAQVQQPDQFLASQTQPQYMTVQGQQYMAVQGQVNQAQYMTAQKNNGQQERHMIPIINPMGSTTTGTTTSTSSNNQNQASTPMIVQPPQENSHVQHHGMGSTGTASTTATTNQEPQLPPPPLAKADNKHGIRRPRPAPRGQAEPVDPSLRTHLVEHTGNHTTMHVTKKQQVYYYDAKDASSSGHLNVPSIVYDEDGNQVSMHALQLQGADIYLEPPDEMLAAAPQQIAMPNTDSWGESSPFQDQSIIVSTVAVMALLVGALSARRLRSRNILSVCIENESLEDEVAYDTAYTTNTDNSYNTFGGWKGDLEKFDV